MGLARPSNKAARKAAHKAARIPPGDAGDAFSEFEQLLVSNSGEDAFDVAVQLLTAKLFDEQETAKGASRKQLTLDGSPRAIHGRVRALYRRAIQRWPDLGTTRPAIDFSPEQLGRCLRPLVGWRILGSDLSHLDAALERLVARGPKGALRPVLHAPRRDPDVRLGPRPVRGRRTARDSSSCSSAACSSTASGRSA